jgi:hypothetical protein
MNRRIFLQRSFAVSAAAVSAQTVAASVSAQTVAASQERGRRGLLYVLVRHYTVMPGTGAQRCDAYFRDAFIPAASRLGLTPIGAFSAWFGPESLSGRYLLVPAPTADVLLNLDVELARDAEYMNAAADFLNAPASQPSFIGLESSLLRTMDRLPGLSVPDRLGRPNRRIFELRTYAQPTYGAHRRKVAMFEEGEADVLAKCGFNAVFHAVNVIGPGVPGASLPALTYMWVYGDLQERERAEVAWGASEDRKMLFANPKFADTPSTISNIILQPTAYSQL